MKELEKTKRISIATVLFILVVIIALLAYEKPKHLYKINSELTLNKILTEDYFLNFKEINNPENVLIDVRNRYEYEKGHLENAINIHTPDLLNNTNTKVFEELKEDMKTIILYGNNPSEANMPFMLLSQLGYSNIKILLVNNSYTQNKLITKSCIIEKSIVDVNAYIKESQKKAVIKPKPKKKIPKKIIPVKKKKKMPVEGGC